VKHVHRLTAAALVTAVMTSALVGCGYASPDGPPGTVASHYRIWKCTQPGKAWTCGWKYRIRVRPDTGGEPVVIRVWRDEQQACSDGDQYPACLPAGSTS
jgi:hypothetical protein